MVYAMLLYGVSIWEGALIVERNWTQLQRKILLRVAADCKLCCIALQVIAGIPPIDLPGV